MRIFSGIADAADAVRAYFLANPTVFPAHIGAKIEPHTRTGASPVDLIVTFTEGVYAARGDVPDDAKAIAAGTANTIDDLGFHGKLDGRAAAMVPALRRDSGEPAGEGRTWPEPETDPAPNADFAAPPPGDE